MNNRDIIITSMLGFISTFEATMILIAVPTISNFFTISHFYASLLITIYVSIEALLFVPFAMVFERIGLKIGMVIGGLLIFSGGVMIYLSSSFLEIELFRVLQATGASMILPT